MKLKLALSGDADKIIEYDKHIPVKRLKESIENSMVYLLEDELGKIKGILRYSLFWHTIPFLDLIYLDEDIRGKGYGTLMMDKWENDMNFKLYEYVMTSTQADETAWQFYEKRGYIKKGGFFPPDQEAEELIYIKEL